MKVNNTNWIISLFLPVTNFITILFNPKRRDFKIAFIMFFIFIALGIYVIYENGGNDLTRYVEEFNKAHSIDSMSFKDYVNSYIAEENQIDQFTNITRWFISRITGNYKVYLCFNVFILALFFSMNVKYIIERSNINNITKLLIAVLIFTPNIIFITHRWWIALQVFVYGLLPIIFEKKYIRFIWCIIAFSFIHFSFLYPCILIIISIILPKRNLLPYLIVFLIFSFLNNLDFGFMDTIINYIAPEDISERSSNYLYGIEIEQNLLAKSRLLFTKIINIVLVCVLYLKTRNEINDNKTIKNVYIIALIFGTFSAITSTTQWGWRYADLSNMLFMILYIYILSDNKIYTKNKNIFKLLSPLFIYLIIYQIRNIFDLIGPISLMAGNIFTGWFIEEEMTVLNFIKYIF
ncbi:MAG: EpsG family protein [Bacteroidales bacterium]|nr:EpsG family protein [Bacteroidales bacterium]